MGEEFVSKFTIVEFQPKYRDQVIELIDSILKEINVIPNRPEKIDDEDLFEIPKVYSDRGRFWVAFEGDTVIGTVAIRDNGENTAKLKRMFVSSEHRGTGLGQKLFDTARDFAAQNGFKQIVLNTHLLMSRAHRFYEKNGFQKIDQDKEKLYYSLHL